MKTDKYFNDGQTVETIYRSFERRKRQKRAKAKKQLSSENNNTIGRILKSFYAPLLVLPIGFIYFWLLFTIHHWL
jgi:hypothetical protein